MGKKIAKERILLPLSMSIIPAPFIIKRRRNCLLKNVSDFLSKLSPLQKFDNLKWYSRRFSISICIWWCLLLAGRPVLNSSRFSLNVSANSRQLPLDSLETYTTCKIKVESVGLDGKVQNSKVLFGGVRDQSQALLSFFSQRRFRRSVAPTNSPLV